MLLKLKPIRNKRNNQVSFSIPKRKLNKFYRGVFDEEPFRVKSLKMRLEDVERE